MDFRVLSHSLRNDLRGFTMMELLVVIAMIAVLIGAVSTAVSSAQQRARIQKATSDVKVVSQAILSYESWARLSNDELPEMEQAEADGSKLGFLLGSAGNDSSGNKIPAVLMAALQSGGKMRDPWGTPYRVTIRGVQMAPAWKGSTLKTGYYFPNQYRLRSDERLLYGGEKFDGK